MKNLWITVLVVLAVAGASYAAFYRLNDDPALRRAARDHDAMAWLRTEFQLTDVQFARIKELHDNYGVQCARHCAAIMKARRTNAPANEIAELEAVCVGSMSEHFQKVARLMAPQQGQRYLALVLPRIKDYAHEGAPTVQVNP